MVQKKDFLSLFRVQKPVLGMLHLMGEDRADVLRRAYAEADIMLRNGVSAVIVENYFGTADDARAVLQAFMQDHVPFVYGVNILHDDVENFRTAMEYGAAFLQLDSVAGHLAPDRDDAFGAFLEQSRAQYGGFVIGGVRFKYQPHNSGRSLEEDLRIGMGRCDAIAVTGNGTGMMTPVDKIREFRFIAGDFPLIVAAGVTPESCSAQFAYADAAIVGSYFKDTYQDMGEVDANHVRAFMEAVELCRQGKGGQP